MFCTDIQVEEGVPEKAFIKAWNTLVSRYEEYLPVWIEAIDGDDVLKAYRAREMMGLVRDTGYIKEMTYELLVKTLSHIEIGYDDTIEVVFLAGVMIEIISNKLKDYVRIPK